MCIELWAPLVFNLLQSFCIDFKCYNFKKKNFFLIILTHIKFLNTVVYSLHVRIKREDKTEAIIEKE